MHLSERGYTCWIMEWRNHGDSSKTREQFNFETIAKYDFESTFDFLFNEKKINILDCLTHSGGGIILTMFLINNQAYISKIKSITFFGVQAFGAGVDIGSRIKLRSGKWLAAIKGSVPAKSVGSSEHSESYYTMKQWFNWNLNKNFIGKDDFDYMKRMSNIDVPILSICAKGDDFIAPKKGCECFLQAFDNNDNKLIYYSLENGNLEDYNHSRILKSQNSKREIWPVVVKWITTSNTD